MAILVHRKKRWKCVINLVWDGAMIGRASIGYPWFFNEVKHFFNTGEHLEKPTIAERTEMARRHLQLAIGWKGERLGIVETRKTLYQLL